MQVPSAEELYCSWGLVSFIIRNCQTREDWNIFHLITGEKHTCQFVELMACDQYENIFFIPTVFICEVCEVLPEQ